jgi:hypothetical protein
MDELAAGHEFGSQWSRIQTDDLAQRTTEPHAVSRNRSRGDPAAFRIQADQLDHGSTRIPSLRSGRDDWRLKLNALGINIA